MAAAAAEAAEVNATMLEQLALIEHSIRRAASPEAGSQGEIIVPANFERRALDFREAGAHSGEDKERKEYGRKHRHSYSPSMGPDRWSASSSPKARLLPPDDPCLTLEHSKENEMDASLPPSKSQTTKRDRRRQRSSKTTGPCPHPGRRLAPHAAAAQAAAQPPCPLPESRVLPPSQHSQAHAFGHSMALAVGADASTSTNFATGSGSAPQTDHFSAPAWHHYDTNAAGRQEKQHTSSAAWGMGHCEEKTRVGFDNFKGRSWAAGQPAPEVAPNGAGGTIPQRPQPPLPVPTKGVTPSPLTRLHRKHHRQPPSHLSAATLVAPGNSPMNVGQHSKKLKYSPVPLSPRSPPNNRSQMAPQSCGGSVPTSPPPPSSIQNISWTHSVPQQHYKVGDRQQQQQAESYSSNALGNGSFLLGSDATGAGVVIGEDKLSFKDWMPIANQQGPNGAAATFSGAQQNYAQQFWPSIKNDQQHQQQVLQDNNALLKQLGNTSSQSFLSCNNKREAGSFLLDPMVHNSLSKKTEDDQKYNLHHKVSNSGASDTNKAEAGTIGITAAPPPAFSLAHERKKDPTKTKHNWTDVMAPPSSSGK